MDNLGLVEFLFMHNCTDHINDDGKKQEHK